MKKNRIWFVIIILLTFIIYVLANRQEALVLLIGMIVALVLSVLIQIMAMTNLKIVTECRENCYINQEIPYEIKINRKKGMPIGAIKLKLKITNILFDECETREIYLQPSEKRRMKFEYLMQMKDCGNVKITLEHVEYFDLMGIFKWKKDIEQMSELLVYPENIKLNVQLSRNPISQIFGETYDPYKRGNDVSEVASLREYVEGDPMGSVHWKLSGKMDELIVREFGNPSNYSTIVVYDMMKQYNNHKISKDRNNAVVALASALSLSLIEHNHEHNVCNVEEDRINISVVDSVNTHGEMVLNMLCKPIYDAKDRVDTIYQFLNSNLKNDYTKMIYITPEYDENYARVIAKYMDLTVINVNDKKGNAYVGSTGYSIIPVEAKDYKGWMRNIVI